MHILILGKPASKGSRSPFFTVRLGKGNTRPPPAGPLSSGCEALPPPPPTSLPASDLSGSGSGAGRPGSGSEFRGKWTVGEGWPELSWIVVSSCRRLGGVERQG